MVRSQSLCLLRRACALPTGRFNRASRRLCASAPEGHGEVEAAITQALRQDRLEDAYRIACSALVRASSATDKVLSRLGFKADATQAASTPSIYTLRGLAQGLVSAGRVAPCVHVCVATHVSRSPAASEPGRGIALSDARGCMTLSWMAHTVTRKHRHTQLRVDMAAGLLASRSADAAAAARPSLLFNTHSRYQRRHRARTDRNVAAAFEDARLVSSSMSASELVDLALRCVHAGGVLVPSGAFAPVLQAHMDEGRLAHAVAFVQHVLDVHEDARVMIAEQPDVKADLHVYSDMCVRSPAWMHKLHRLAIHELRHHARGAHVAIALAKRLHHPLYCGVSQAVAADLITAYGVLGEPAAAHALYDGLRAALRGRSQAVQTSMAALPSTTATSAIVVTEHGEADQPGVLVITPISRRLPRLQIRFALEPGEKLHAHVVDAMLRALRRCKQLSPAAVVRILDDARAAGIPIDDSIAESWITADVPHAGTIMAQLMQAGVPMSTKTTTALLHAMCNDAPQIPRLRRVAHALLTQAGWMPQTASSAELNVTRSDNVLIRALQVEEDAPILDVAWTRPSSERAGLLRIDDRAYAAILRGLAVSGDLKGVASVVEHLIEAATVKHARDMSFPLAAALEALRSLAQVSPDVAMDVAKACCEAAHIIAPANDTTKSPSLLVHVDARTYIEVMRACARAPHRSDAVALAAGVHVAFRRSDATPFTFAMMEAAVHAVRQHTVHALVADVARSATRPHRVRPVERTDFAAEWLQQPSLLRLMLMDAVDDCAPSSATVLDVLVIAVAQDLLRAGAPRAATSLITGVTQRSDARTLDVVHSAVRQLSTLYEIHAAPTHAAVNERLQEDATAIAERLHLTSAPHRRRLRALFRAAAPTAAAEVALQPTLTWLGQRLCAASE